MTSRSSFGKRIAAGGVYGRVEVDAAQLASQGSRSFLGKSYVSLVASSGGVGEGSVVGMSMVLLRAQGPHGHAGDRLMSCRVLSRLAWVCQGPQSAPLRTFTIAALSLEAEER